MSGVVRGVRICYPVLARGRRWLECHGAEGVHERLLVPARAIPGCPAWRRNKCGLLVQWLLMLPGHESYGRVVTWRGQEGLQELLSHRYRAGVHGDVPLPRVDVRRPWRSGPAVVAGGSSGGRGGVTRVTTTATTAVVVLIAVATTVIVIAAVVVLVSVVVAVGHSGRHGRLRLRSRRHSAGVECRRSSKRSNGDPEVDLQKEVIANFKKVQEQRRASYDGPEVLEALIETAKDVEDEDPVIDGQPQVG
jgi:hypothetical protein